MDPMMMTVLFGASFVNAIAPGPCIVLTISRSSCHGMIAGLVVTTGVILADTVLGWIASAMILGLILMSTEALGLARWAGICILLWMAVKMMRSRPPIDSVLQPRPSRAGNLVSGFLVGASSPFNLVFLLALFPQFLPEASISATDLLVAVTIFVTGSALAQIVAVICGSFLNVVLRDYGSWVERIGGIMLAGFALSLWGSGLPS